MAEFAKLISRGEQRFCPATQRVITTLFAMTADGQDAVVDTCVITVEAFVRSLAMQQRTMDAIQRHQAQAYIASLPKGRRRKAPSNVVALKR